MPCMPASHSRGLNKNYCWLSQAKANEQNWHDRPPSDAESVLVPYSNPMFDVQSGSRFYQCSITDVYIGRSLLTIIGVHCSLYMYIIMTVFTNYSSASTFLRAHLVTRLVKLIQNSNSA